MFSIPPPTRASLVVQPVRSYQQCRRPGFNPWVGKIPWRRERLPTPVFWPGESHGLHSPGGCKESDTTYRLSGSFIPPPGRVIASFAARDAAGLDTVVYFAYRLGEAFNLLSETSLMNNNSIVCVWVWLVAQLCPTLCNPMDCGLPGSSTLGILQARILE